MAKRKTREDSDVDDNKTLRKARYLSDEHSLPLPSTAVTTRTPKSALRKSHLKTSLFQLEDSALRPSKTLKFRSSQDLKDSADHSGHELQAEDSEIPARRTRTRTPQWHYGVGDATDYDQEESDQALTRAALNDCASIENDTTSESETPKSKLGTRSVKKAMEEVRPNFERDMPPHEVYFFQNKTGTNKTSTNTLPSYLLHNHDDYRERISIYTDPHQSDAARLRDYHRHAFDQWLFELDEGFNLCLYGYGSKQHLLKDFASHVYQHVPRPSKIIIANGYTPGITIRDIIGAIAAQVLPKSSKLPIQPTAALEMLLASLTENSTSQIILMVHSLDHSNLRSSCGLIARLASSARVSLVASCDSLNFALLWNLHLLNQLQFVYHDATTFAPYDIELDPVEDVNSLLGRSSRRFGGKDGVGYVLKSLPENARNLFRLLVVEQLASTDTDPEQSETHAPFTAIVPDDEDILGMSDEEAAAVLETPSRRGRGRGRAANDKSIKLTKPTSNPAVQRAKGVDFRTLYHKAVEEFVCSSELNFRTLLKEFHDHQMVESRKDSLGAEVLLVPFRQEELETILGELV